MNFCNLLQKFVIDVFMIDCQREAGCCTHRLRRLCTGLRNTDITGAHGLVIHGSLYL